VRYKHDLPRDDAAERTANAFAEKKAKVTPRGRNTRTADEWAKSINTEWQKPAESIIKTGHILIEAKAELPHGEFEDMIEEKLKFGSRTAQRLMRIAEHRIISNPTHVSHLPPSWGTLYALTELPDEVLHEMLEDGTLHCEITRKEVDDVKAKVDFLGHYRWVNLRDALEQLITFSERWSNVHEMVELMQRGIERSFFTELDDKLVDYTKLNEVSKWISEFGSEATRVVQERDRLDAERERRRAEEEEQRRAKAEQERRAVVPKRLHAARERRRDKAERVPQYKDIPRYKDEDYD
jgi:hypothetical protein